MPKRLRKKKPKHSRLRRVFRTLYGGLVLLSTLVVVSYAAFKLVVRPPDQAAPPMATLTAATDRPDTPEDESRPTTPPLQRQPGVYTFLLAAGDVGGGNADTIMVAKYDVTHKTVGVVSIPRDTMTARYAKINAAYGKGPENLKTVVADLVGIPIDYYLTVNVRAFQAIINAVDGVDFYVPCDMNYDDTTPGQELRIHYSEGMQHLNGRQALEVVRFRHNNDGSGYTDTGRAKTQQALMKAVAKKLLSLSSVGKFNEFVEIFTKNVKTDLAPTDLAYFASSALSVDLSSGVAAATLPGDGDVTYKGTSWCYQLYPSECLEIFNQLINPYTTAITRDMTNIVQVK